MKKDVIHFEVVRDQRGTLLENPYTGNDWCPKHLIPQIGDCVYLSCSLMKDPDLAKSPYSFYKVIGRRIDLRASEDPECILLLQMIDKDPRLENPETFNQQVPLPTEIAGDSFQ